MDLVIRPEDFCVGRDEIGPVEKRHGPSFSSVGGAAEDHVGPCLAGCEENASGEGFSILKKERNRCFRPYHQVRAKGPGLKGQISVNPDRLFLIRGIPFDGLVYVALSDGDPNGPLRSAALRGPVISISQGNG
jgi:hypothetical protein